MSANVSILGNLGKNPESRVNAEGTFITNFSIASNSVRNTPNGTMKKTDWFRVTAMGKQAEVLAEYAKKGNRLLVQGKLTFNPWVTREGSPQVSADILLQDFQFAGSSNDNADNTDQSEDDTPEHTVETEISGDIQEISNQSNVY